MIHPSRRASVFGGFDAVPKKVYMPCTNLYVFLLWYIGLLDQHSNMGPNARSRPRPAPPNSAPYTLSDWHGFPGLGEHVRLAFEATGTLYTSVSIESEDGIHAVLGQLDTENQGDDYNPPPRALPVLQHGDSVTLSETTNILAYLGPRLNLIPNPAEDAAGPYHINSFALIALDGQFNEVPEVRLTARSRIDSEKPRDTTHEKAKDYRETGLPKFLEYFQRVLSGSASQGGDYLYGGELTYADLVLFQTIDAVRHAFPRRMKALRKSDKFNKVFALYEQVAGLDSLSAYLKSDRRQKHLRGTYKHYPELDEE